MDTKIIKDHPCLCNVCLDARNKELERALTQKEKEVREEIVKDARLWMKDKFNTTALENYLEIISPQKSHDVKLELSKEKEE